MLHRLNAHPKAGPLPAGTIGTRRREWSASVQALTGRVTVASQRVLQSVIAPGGFPTDMAGEISAETMETWLEDLPAEVFDRVGRVDDPTGTFNFVVEEGSGVVVNVAHPGEGEPILIGTDVTFRGEPLDAVHAQRERFFTEVGSVLTNAPGIYAYTDEDGNRVPNEDFTTVSLRHWIYPAGISQHEVLTGLIDIFNAAAYVRDCAARLRDQPDLFR